MNEVAPMTESMVPPEQLQRILTLYDDGLYLQAFRVANEFGPLDKWRGTDARILAGRLAGNLGAPRLGDWHFLHAWRKDRQHPDALWSYTRTLLAIRGPLAAWKFVRGQTFPATAPKKSLSHWLSLHGSILGLLRDFDAAEEWLKKADELGPQPWTLLEWAALYSLEDRHEDAETAARRALERKPWYRPAVQWVAHFLVQKERDEEAIGLLTQATQRLESGAVYAQLAILQIELKRYDEAARSLDAFEKLSPLLSAEQKPWLDARRCDLACFRGDYDHAVAYARSVMGQFGDATPSTLAERRKKERVLRAGGKFYESLLKGLRNRPADAKRVEVPVGFVRQHHKTCAPATLTSIAKFWAMPAEHVEVADEISYSGTPHHSERKWALDHGWHTKAFTVTWEAAVALLDRGIPFTLTTTEVSSAHMQAVIGYDSTRGTLILRDPGERHRVEMPFDLLKERYRATGPRGLALVPMAQKATLDALPLPLPDESLYEKVQRFDLALEGHRRAEAEQAMQTLAAQAPQHFLTLFARRALANYDGDQPAGLDATAQLLQLFPGDLFLELARADYLRVLGRREQRLEILKRLSEKKETDPACWQFYAEELATDPRRDTETLYLLKRAIRATAPTAPLQGRLLDLFARIRLDQRKFDEALQLHHFAVCAEDKDEYIAQNYFQNARARGESERALQFLQKRFQRFGAKSSQPARTLCNALMQMERPAEAFDILEQAMRLRPKDGDLLTYAADAHTYRAEFDEAEQILAKADGVSKPAARLRSLGYLAISRGERLKARGYYQEVLKIEPLAEDAHRWYVQLVAERDERPAAIKHIADTCQRFPHHFGLTRIWYDWLFDDGPAAREPVIEKLIDISPSFAWTRVEYAYNLADQDRLDEAHLQLDEAEPLEPDGPNAWFARGFLHKKRGRTEDAQFAFREALRHAIDFEAAIHELLGQCENLQDRREAVAFIVSELLRQATSGAGIVALVSSAQPVFPPDELLASLRRILEARSDLWQAWSAVTRQCGFADRPDEYLASAQKAIQRFPAFPALWLDLAQAQRVHQNTDAELQALQRAAELAPNWIDTLRSLAAAHERAGSIDEAKKVFEHAIRRTPLVPVVHLEHAELLYRLGERDLAIHRARQALKLDPWFDNAWTRLCTWLAQLDRVDEAIELAQAWTKERPGDARSWLRLAQAYHWKAPRAPAKDESERIDNAAAYDAALQRSPYARDIYDLKAEMLGFVGRRDAALKACNPPVFMGKSTIELRGRAAWIKAMQQDYDAAKEQMRAILKEDRAYVWGLNQLVDWSYATHDFKAYHDVAAEMLRVRPQSAAALAYRGEARVRMDEREDGLEDLRNAQRKDPCNTLAAFLLFDEQMNDESHATAETTLLSIQQNIVGDFVKARQVQFHARRENQTIALEIFKNLCTSTFPQPQPMDMAMRALDRAGWKRQAEQIVLDAMQKPNWHTHLAVMFAARWNPTLASDLPDRVAALDRALAKAPMTFVFLDLKADLLTNANQFERAWQVCQEKTFPQDQFALDGRAAWVYYRSGRVADAFERMKQIVKANPKYHWGWWQLADWHGRQQNWVEVLTVAEQLVVIGPRDPSGYAFRGQAKQFLGDPQAARADFLHALDLDPAYVFAAWNLFDIAVRASEWQRAEKILDKAKKHADKAEWALRKVDLLVYQNRKSAFPAEFENLCRNAEKAPWLVDQSLNFLVQAGWWSDAEEVLHRCLDLGPHICDPWVRLRVQMGDRKVGDDVQNMSARRPERTNCIAAYATELAFAKEKSGLHSWILTHEDALRADTPSWAMVGRALAVIADWPGLADWMSDWADHTKATPAFLLPLIKALRSLGRIDEARKVGLFALTKLSADYANSYHKVWLMLDQALDRDVLPVQRYLETSDLGGLDGYHQMIAAMVRALWLTTTDKAAGFARARQLLVDAAKLAPPTIHDPALSKSYQNCIGVLATIHGTVWAKIWRVWRWFSPLLPPVQKSN